jgi:hypothetical protein
MRKKWLKSCAVVILVIVVFLILIGCTNSDEPEKTVEYYMDEYGGMPEVYEEILATTNCDTLWEKFWVASENNDRQTPGTSLFKITLGYMEAAWDQMEKYDCYD